MSIALASTLVRPARPDEASTLSELAVRSKAWWGYDVAFLDRCRRELETIPGRLLPLLALDL